MPAVRLPFRAGLGAVRVDLMRDPPPLGQRLFWFAALWIASVAALGLVAWAIRAVLPP